MLKFIFLSLIISFSSLAKEFKEYIIHLNPKNTVVLWDSVCDQSINDVLAELNILKNVGTKEVYLVINTYGGNYRNLYKIKEFSELYNIKINTISIHSISAGYLLVQDLDTRYVTKTSHLMIHEVRYFDKLENFTLSQLEAFYKKYKKAIENDYQNSVLRTKIPLEKFKKIISPELHIDYKYALTNNHADKLAKIVCSTDMVDYIKQVTIDNALYEITFPGCPTSDEPILVRFISGYQDLQTLTKVAQRFFPKRNE